VKDYKKSRRRRNSTDSKKKVNSIGRKVEKEDISYQMTLMKREDTGNRKRSTRFCQVETSRWKRLWTCRKTNNRINE
jgi:hypothetical protein